MRMKNVAFAAIWLAVLLTPASVVGQTNFFQYAVKFVCGKSAGTNVVVAPGEYFTAINVHNPNGTPVAFRKKFAIALPGEKAGRVSRFFDTKLGPDEAFEIDNLDIHRHTDTGRDAFVKGFVVIESPLELDVVAVYTAAGRTRMIETMEIERVPARRSRGGLADLVPVPNPNPGTGFCRLIQSGPYKGKLLVTVKNQRSADAPLSTSKIDFSPGGSISLPTPAIPAGTSVNLSPVSIPGPCFDPDCNFKITVDSNDDMNESDEGNNSAAGACLG